MKRTICLALLLAGCASNPEMVWVGKSETEFYADQATCEGQAISATAGNPMAVAPQGTWAFTQIKIQQVQIFQACMRSKGWRRVPAS